MCQDIMKYGIHIHGNTQKGLATEVPHTLGALADNLVGELGGTPFFWRLRAPADASRTSADMVTAPSSTCVDVIWKPFAFLLHSHDVHVLLLGLTVYIIYI